MQNWLKFYEKMDRSVRIRIIYNVKHRYVIRMKFGDKFLTSPTKLVLKKKSSICSTIKENLLLYCYIVIFFCWLWLAHELRSACNLWCQRFIMLALKCDIVLFASQIWDSCFSSWKASLIYKCQYCYFTCQR